jgi:hypothetical protein
MLVKERRNHTSIFRWLTSNVLLPKSFYPFLFYSMNMDKISVFEYNIRLTLGFTNNKDKGPHG